MLLHEDRLDGAISSKSIGLGETVRVTTKMGDQLDRGRVKASSPFGLLLVCSDGEREVENFYSDRFYLFIPEVREERPVILREDPRKHNIMDMSPDERVRHKLRMLEQDEEPEEVPGSEDPTAVPDGPEGGMDDGTPPENEMDTQVDVDALPDDIKAAIITTKEMDPEGVNTLLTLVGDAAVKGLQRAGVASTEQLGLAQAIQNATYAVLTRRGLARDTLKDVKPKKKK